MRLFWACTHFTLRQVELPLLIEAGFEVVPEEANIDVLSPSEADTYDEQSTAIDRLWRDAVTISDTDIDICRRARLTRRGGILTPAEQNLFNALFDVIYVATFLDVAANVATWFKGEVVFRYFGNFNNLVSLSEMAKHLDPVILRGIYCVPILRTLEDEMMASIFERYSTVHSFVDCDAARPAWKGVAEPQKAIVVLSGVHEGEPLNLLRSIAPIAREIPVLVLGRNDPTIVPPDLSTLFEIGGTCDRDVHFDRMSRARFVMYPSSSTHHMHYVPLEAIAAGIPLICRASIPLIREYAELSGKAVVGLPGVTASHEEFMAACISLYREPEVLAEMARSQPQFTIAFRRDRVLGELRTLRKRLAFPAQGYRWRERMRFRAIRLLRRDTPGRGQTTYLSTVPTTQYLRALRAISEKECRLSVAELIADLENAILVPLDHVSDSICGVILSGITGPRLIPLGFRDSKFAPDMAHELELEFEVLGEIALVVEAEIWVNGEVMFHTCGCSDRLAETAHSVTLSFSADNPAGVLLNLRTLGDHGEVAVATIRHRISERPVVREARLSGVIISDAGLNDALVSTDRTVRAIDLARDMACAAWSASRGAQPGVELNDATSSWLIALGFEEVAFAAGRQHRLSVSFESANDAALLAEGEIWAAGMFERRVTACVASLEGQRHRLVLSFASDHPSAAIFKITRHGRGRVLIHDIEHQVGAVSLPGIRIDGAARSPHRDDVRRLIEGNAVISMFDILPDTGRLRLCAAASDRPADWAVGLPQSPSEQVIALGFEDGGFARGQLHEVTIACTIEGTVVISGNVEIWSENLVECRIVGLSQLVSGDFDITLSFATEQPASLLIVLRVEGEGRLFMRHVAHKIGAQALPQASFDHAMQIDVADTADRLVSMQVSVPIARLIPDMARLRVVDQDLSNPRLALVLTAEQPELRIPLGFRDSTFAADMVHEVKFHCRADGTAMLLADAEIWMHGKVNHHISSWSGPLGPHWAYQTFSFAPSEPAALLLVFRAKGPGRILVDNIQHQLRLSQGDRPLGWKCFASQIVDLANMIRSEHGCKITSVVENANALTIQSLTIGTVVGVMCTPENGAFMLSLDRRGVRLDTNDNSLWCEIVALDEAVVDIVIELWAEKHVAQSTARVMIEPGAIERCLIRLPQNVIGTVPVLFMSTISGSIILTALGLCRD